MIIERNGRQISLTGSEIHKAYLEQKHHYAVVSVKNYMEGYLEKADYIRLKENKEYIEMTAELLTAFMDGKEVDYKMSYLKDAILIMARAFPASEDHGISLTTRNIEGELRVWKFDTAAEILKKWWDEDEVDCPGGDDEVEGIYSYGKMIPAPKTFGEVITEIEIQYWRDLEL